MVNLKKTFLLKQIITNFIIAISIIIIIMNIFIKNSNNNILLKKEKKRFLDCPKVTFFQTGFEPGTFEFATRRKVNLNGYSQNRNNFAQLAQRKKALALTI